MQIMHEKGMVERDTNQKTHIYKAIVNQDKTEKQLVNKMIDNVFNGSAARLVMQALGNHSASADEIDEIKKYLEAIRKNNNMETFVQQFIKAFGWSILNSLWQSAIIYGILFIVMFSLPKLAAKYNHNLAFRPSY